MPSLGIDEKSHLADLSLFLGSPDTDATRRPQEAAAGYASIRSEGGGERLVVLTSIVSLPPIFLFRRDSLVAITSDVALLRLLPGAALTFSAVAVTELARLGHPTGHRSLFREVELVPAGSRVEVSSRGEISVSRAWMAPARDPRSQDEFIESQIAAFDSAVRRLDTENSFLSLTGGLDTRAVLSGLARHGKLVPAVTMTGARRSLDARIASQLAAAYDVNHTLVTFADDFTRLLPELVQRASLLSGGIDAFSQAPEVFLYSQLPGNFASRISGNLGNQVGRGGTEGLGGRRASTDILAPHHRAEVREHADWLVEELQAAARDPFEFLLQQEVPFTLLGNYSVGSSFAAQSSPYADRGLIETLSCRPMSPGAHSGESRIALRARDLRHRFLGAGSEQSFQRRLIVRAGGPASSIPVNWGWRPKGGISIHGSALGIAALAGIAARAGRLDRGPLSGVLAKTGILALNNFRDPRQWLQGSLRDFAFDMIGATLTSDPSLFDSASLGRHLNEHFSGARDHFSTVTFALDLALAHRHFIR